MESKIKALILRFNGLVSLGVEVQMVCRTEVTLLM